MMFREWFGLFLRHTAYALTLVTGLLLIGEILVPGLVLPFLNLHVLVITTLVLDLCVPFVSVDEGTNTWARPYRRIAAVLPVAILLVVSAMFLLAGLGTSAMLLVASMGMLIVGIVIAIAYAKH